MAHWANRDNDDRQERPDGGNMLSPIGWASAALAVALGVLSLVPGTPVDLRGCAPLAAAWLDVFIVAIGVSLAQRASGRPSGGAGWRAIAGALWHAIRRPPDSEPDSNPWTALVDAVDRRPWVLAACGGVSVAIALTAWRAPATQIHGANSSTLTLAAGAVALALAFATLVAERHHAAGAAGSPLSASLARMLRAALFTTLAATASAAWFAAGYGTADWLIRAAALLNAAVGAELAVRGVLSWFSVLRDGDVPSSTIAGLLRVRPAPWVAVGTGLRERYGINLRQNWGLRSFLRLLPAAAGATLACAWLLSAVVVLAPNQRAVYERFGAPVAVWQPGPHVGLPWPFGRAHVVDNGAVHQVIVSGGADHGSIDAPAAPSDGPAPDALNRLWDAPHPWETTQVIAGASGDRQNFQIVSADVRIDYRLGATDADARAALYRAVDPEGTVRATANREVLHYLASHTLESLLETSQSTMADTMRRAIQQQLDRLGSGIDVVAVVIESVHPPTGAAAAYHDVQAAQIRAQGSVAQARGFAAGLLGNAQQQAISRVAQAEARAGDALSAARVQQIDFEADTVAYRLGGPAFPFEYYLGRLQRGLRNARMTIIDDRLADGTRATVDLRAYPAGDLAGIR
ncbi:Membrane protease [Burkholderia multivorans]